MTDTTAFCGDPKPKEERKKNNSSVHWFGDERTSHTKANRSREVPCNFPGNANKITINGLCLGESQPLWVNIRHTPRPDHLRVLTQGSFQGLPIETTSKGYVVATGGRICENLVKFGIKLAPFKGSWS